MGFLPYYSWHEDCSTNSIPSMLSEMTAMNSTLLLLNTLALAVLLVFHFQPEPASTGQPVEMTATFNPPLPTVIRRKSLIKQRVELHIQECLIAFCNDGFLM